MTKTEACSAARGRRRADERQHVQVKDGSQVKTYVFKAAILGPIVLLLGLRVLLLLLLLFVLLLLLLLLLLPSLCGATPADGLLCLLEVSQGHALVEKSNKLSPAACDAWMNLDILMTLSC